MYTYPAQQKNFKKEIHTHTTYMTTMSIELFVIAKIYKKNKTQVSSNW
jgi:hypothetical protein